MNASCLPELALGKARQRVCRAGRLVAALLAAALVLGGCQYRSASEAREALREEEAQAAAPDQVSRDVSFFIYENDRPRALVEAYRMERYQNEDSTYTLLKALPHDSLAATAGEKSSSGRVTAYIFDAQERPEEEGSPSSASANATIRADRLVYHDDAGRFDAHGRVVVVTDAGKRLESEHLAWIEQEQRIATPGFVNITTATDRIQGYGLEADETLDAYQLERVTGQVTVEDTP